MSLVCIWSFRINCAKGFKDLNFYAMNTISDVSFAAEYPGSGKLKRTKPNRYFFVVMAVLFPVITFLGFFPSFQSMQQGTLEVHWLVHVHSAIMTSWLLLYLTQTILAATGNLRIHKQLGILSFALGILVTIIMVLVSFHFIFANHPPEGSFMFDLLLFNFYSISCFALFFWWGMSVRKKDPAAHKRLLTFATLALLIAAVDRIQRNDSFPSLGLEYPAFSFIYLDVLLIPIFLYDLLRLKKIHKITLIATAILILAQVIVTKGYGSPSWHRFWFRSTAPFMEKVVEINLSDAQSAPLLGDYESPIGDITISRNNGKLYIQFSGGEKEELGAISETELFFKADVMNFFFVKAPNGKIISAEAKAAGRIYKMTKKNK